MKTMKEWSNDIKKTIQYINIEFNKGKESLKKIKLK